MAPYIGKGGDTPTEGTAASRRREQSVGVVEGVKVFQATNRRDRTRSLVSANHPGRPGKRKER